MADQYKALAERIKARSALLRTVADTTLDLMVLKDAQGRYQLVGRAFGEMFGKAPDALVGSSDDEAWPPEACARLAVSEQNARSLGIDIDDAVPVGLEGETRHFHVMHVAVPNERGSSASVLMVARDISDLIAARAERQKLAEQTVEAFQRAVELVDPYLEGHSRRMVAVCRELAAALELEENEAKTLELAAGLSQIGKMLVPKEIVAKPDRHTPEEAAVMRTHVEHARRILSGISFGLPVAECVAGMHERLDGSGYPEGRRGDGIGRPERILAVADVFCARTRPRAYRDKAAPSDVVDILRKADERYDARVIDALGILVDAGDLGAEIDTRESEAGTEASEREVALEGTDDARA